jgi:aspartyl-tRNA(Asn)/glutamyl-tRNA(Gln) amidotransferase subunit A
MSVHAGMSATEIVASVHDGSRTVREVLDFHLSQIERFDEEVKAFATINQDLARDSADSLDLLRDNGARLPLHGIPVGVKDIIDVAGLPTIAGFAPYRDRIANRDAEIVARLKSLGALVIGKTHTTQFAVGDPAPTRNPWNLEKSPAGSSAGSGAAIPAGMAPVTIGSQTAGSMLRPAAFNGAVGFKPSFGWMPMGGVIPLCWSLDHLGLYAGNVEDVSLVYRNLAGSSGEHDSPNRRPRIPLLTEYLEMSEPYVSDHLRQLARSLEHEGAIVEEVNLPVSFQSIFAPHQVIFAAEMAAVHAVSISKHRDHYSPKIRTGVEAGSLIPATYLLHAQRLQRRLMREANEWLGYWDAALLPTVSSEATDSSETGDRRFQIPATLLGLPALSLPTGLGPTGLPLGTQVIGRAGSETELLGLASWITGVTGLIGRPSQYG